MRLRRTRHPADGGGIVSETSGAVRFLYGTVPGRMLLKAIMKSHTDRLAVAFLRSRWSRPVITPYAKHHGVELPQAEFENFHTFRDFFARSRNAVPIDATPGHLISPCDGWLSAYPIQENSSFAIKNSHYRLADFLQDAELAERFHGGDCLIFRLCASDYHHYCYIDDCYQGVNHFIPGMLHSVQPIACETYPVYVLNRRSWTLLTTEHFGPVVQTEIGALVVGGICNPRENLRVCRGQEKGHFELAGSTIVLLFQKGKILLRPDILEHLKHGEFQVHQGMWIGEQVFHKTDTI